MKVVILSDVYLPFLSGVSTVTYLLSKELPRFGVKTTLVVPSPSFHLSEVESLDEKYNRKILLVPSTRLFKIYSELRFPIKFYTPNDELDDECILNIHSPMILGTASVKKLRKLRDKGYIKCGFVGVFHTRMSEYLLRRMNPKISNKLARLLDFYTKHIFNRMDITIVLSNYMKKMAMKMGIKNSIILPNPLNRAYFEKPTKSIDHYYHELEPKNYFLYLGRISHEKKVDLLAEVVCKKTNSYKFVFAGSGPLLEYLTNRHRGKNCIFLGRVPFSAQRALYQGALAFVSASDWETQGLVFLEAMAQGVPVVASKYGGQRDYLVNGFNSLLFEELNEIPTLLEKIKVNDDLRDYLGGNARRTAEMYHPDRIIPKYIKLFETVLEKIK